MIIPFFTQTNVIRFLVRYEKLNNKINGNENSKSFIIEVTNSEGEDVVTSISNKSFNGNIIIYNLQGHPIHKSLFKDNKLEKNISPMYLEGGRGDECSADGVGFCAGEKFQSQGWLEKAICLMEIVPCMAILAADCYIENCIIQAE